MPSDAIDKRTEGLRTGKAFDMKLPGRCEGGKVWTEGLRTGKAFDMKLPGRCGLGGKCGLRA